MTATTTSATKAPETEPFSCPPDHPHGRTVNCYKTHRCRCPQCRAASARKEKARKDAKRTGRYAGGPRDPEKAAQHVEFLLGTGMTMESIGERAGIAPRTVGEIAVRKRPIFGTTERAVLATKPHHDTPHPRDHVSQLGTKRRLQALMAIGYTLEDMSARIGRNKSWGSRALAKFDAVEESTRIAVEAMFRELAMTPAPRDAKSARTISYAKRKGYAPPLAWDDIDNPAEIPNVTGEHDDTVIDEVAVERALRHGRQKLTPAEKRVAVTRAHSWRWSDGLTAQQLRISSQTVFRIRGELGLEAWPPEDLITTKYERDAA